MGQSCFHTGGVGQKNRPKHFQNAAAGATTTTTRTAHGPRTPVPKELGICASVDAIASKSPIIACTRRVIDRYRSHREGSDAESLRASNILTATPPFSAHKNFEAFGGVFQGTTAALSVRSCEDAKMPNHILVGGEDGSIVLMDYHSGKAARRYSVAHSRDVNCLTRPIRSGLFASASRDKLVKVWNIQSDKPLCELRGHTVKVTGVTMDTAGNFLVSGSRDNTVRLWDVEREVELDCCDVKQNLVHFVEWVPQLQCVVQGGEDLTVRLWDVRTGSNSRNALSLTLASTLTCMDCHPLCCELPPNDVNCTLLTGHSGFNGHGAYVVEWELRMQRRLRTFHAHHGAVRSIVNWVLPGSSSRSHFASAGDDGATAFFSTETAGDETDVVVEPEDIYKLPEGRVTCLDAHSNSDIFVSTEVGAVIVFRPTRQNSGVVFPVERFRYFGSGEMSSE